MGNCNRTPLDNNNVFPKKGSSKSASSTSEPCERIKTLGSENKPPCAVIVTIFEGCSYDPLFREVDQTSPDPEYSVAVFSMTYAHLADVVNPARASSPTKEVSSSK